MLRHKHFTQDVDKVRRRGTGIRDLEVRKQDVIGEQWSPGVGEGTAVPAGLKGSIHGCQVPSPDPATPLPRNSHASPPYPTQFLRLPVSCQHPPSPSKTDKVAAHFLQCYIIAAQFGVRIKPIYIEM